MHPGVGKKSYAIYVSKNQLFRIYKLLYEEQEKRENEMLQNIYTDAKEHSYNKAIFTLGAAHRQSIIQKIQKYKGKEKFKLNWTFYNE